MTARHRYRNDDGVMEAVDAVLRWAYQASEKANEGEAGTWEVVVDDPDMTLDFVGHRRYIVYEDESDDENELLVDGITQAVRIAHTGGDVTNPTGRVWIIEIADLNTLFTYRVMTGSDSQRPDETDIERVLDIIGSEEMGYVDDLTYVSSDDPTDMDEANVRGQTTGQVFDQAAQESSKNYWISSYGTIAGGATMFVFYDHDSSEAYSSPLSLSNAPADLDMHAVNEGTALVLPIGKDTELRRDYARVYDGAYGEFQGGAKYIGRDENPDPPNITVSGRDIPYPAPEVTKRSTMKARLLRVLARHKTPDEIIKTTLFGVHARQATMIRKGMRIAVKATHEPGYEDFRYLRILSAQPKPVGAKYDIALELQGPGSPAPIAPVLALLSSRDDDDDATTMPAGWSSIVRYFPDGPGGADLGLLLARGPRTEQTITFEHGSQFNELMGAQVYGLDLDGMGTPATDLDAGGSTGMSIDVVAGGEGIVMVGIRVNNADDGATWTSKPAGWVSIFERTITSGSGERDWGAVLWGYKKVSSAGTYTMSFTMSSTFADWYKVLVGVWIPTTDEPDVVQIATSGEVIDSTPTMTFPGPL